MKILLTGGSGFVGRNVKEYLTGKGFDVYAPSSSELDCVDETRVVDCLKNGHYDIVLHFAVYNGGSDRLNGGTGILEYNLRIFHNFFSHSDLFGRMIYTGSGAEYDKRFPIISVSEEDVERHSIPIDPYGLMKYTINQLTERSTNIYNLRLFGIFGKYEYWKTKFISNLCCKSLKGLPLSLRQNCYFDYLWIDDFCRLLEQFICLKNPKYHVYNVASGKRISLLELAQLVNEVADEQREIIICNDGIANEYTANNARIRQQFVTWQPTDIRTSVTELYGWYKEHVEEIDTYTLIYG